MNFIPMNFIRGAITLSLSMALYGAAQTDKNSSQPAAGSGTSQKQAAITQTGDVMKIAVNGPRPLEQAMQALAQKYGWVINYEDPQYVSHVDFVEVPQDTISPRIPAGGDFSAEFPAAAPDEEKTLRLVVDAYNQGKNPGQFELRHVQDKFYVVGTAAHDDKGAIVPQQVPLDLSVTVPTKERPIAETINLIAQKISKSSHAPVILGIYPRNLLDNTPVKIGGTKVAARELLLQSLQAVVNRNFYWRLLYDPSTKTYVLNIHSVRHS